MYVSHFRYPLDVRFGQGELAHRALKAFYPLTSKLDTPGQLAKHERRRRVLRRVAEIGGVISGFDSHSPTDVPPSVSSRNHHHIATTQSNPINLFAFLREHGGDPAVKVCTILQLDCISHVFHNDCTRILYRDSRTTSFTGFGNSTLPIATTHSRMKNITR